MEDALKIVAVRQSQGVLCSVDEVLVRTALPHAVVGRLRESAVFIR